MGSIPAADEDWENAPDDRPHTDVSRFLNGVYPDFRRASWRQDSFYTQLAGTGDTGTKDGVRTVLEGPTVLANEATACDLHAPLISVFFFGSFRAYFNGLPITGWASTKARSLFRFLVANRATGATREKILDALWPETDGDSSGNSLRVAVHSLRKAVAESDGDSDPRKLVRFEHGVYRWDPGIVFWIDTEEFEQHYLRGLELERSGAHSEAARELMLADRLYAGDFTEDGYEDWALLKSEALKDKGLSVLARLIQHAVNEGDFEDTVHLCQKILERDPCREDAYRWLMLAYARMGQRSRVLAWYRVCAEILQHELDVEPSPETEGLLNDLLS